MPSIMIKMLLRLNMTFNWIAVARRLSRWVVALSLCLTALPFSCLANADVVLFSGGYKDSTGNPAWADRIGTFDGSQSVMWPATSCDPATGACQGTVPVAVHAEAQHYDALGTNFIYSADIKVQAGADAHLQFRIADEGRFGVSLNTTSITFYDFHLAPRVPCSGSTPDAITHCPKWTFPDQPKFTPIRSVQFKRPLASNTKHQVKILAKGLSFEVWLDGIYEFTALPSVATSFFQVGRFGLYVYGDPVAVKNTVYSNVKASANPLAKENFSLLYSTAGYDAKGVKRALVRTLTDVSDVNNSLAGSKFKLQDSHGVTRASGPLTLLPGKTYGMQLWEADFSDVTTKELYTLSVDINESLFPFHWAHKVTTLLSAPFEIRNQLVTSQFLKPMSFVNAEVRRSASEDFWRNWQVEPTGSTAWKVGVDGAFIADRADANAGATLVRVFNTNNEALQALAGGHQDFRLVGQVTVVSGCDAQLRFQENSGDWIAVTLQAGASGGCPFDSGPGAVRISREGPNANGGHGGFEGLVSSPFSPNTPFQVDHPYDVEVLVNGSRIEVYIDREQGATTKPFVYYNGLQPRSGLFALKAWASTVRFEDIQAWLATVKFVPLPPRNTRIPTFQNYDKSTGITAQVPCQYAPRTCVDKDNKATDDPTLCRNPVLRDSNNFPYEEFNACNPIFSQLHGFHDSSSQVAEATSHGAFLAGLMQIWKSRAASLSPDEREMLRRAIVTDALYLDKLFEEGGQTGQFAHSEMGRVEVDFNGLWNTATALYGESSFADDGATVDRALAYQACSHVKDASEWLWPTNDFSQDPFLASVVFTRLARCADREGWSGLSSTYWSFAEEAADRAVNLLSQTGGLRDINRDHGRVVPWFEGIYEILQSFPDLRATYIDRLNGIAGALVKHLTATHPCDEDDPTNLSQCPPNGFAALPQASGDLAVSQANWVNMQDVPQTAAAATLPFVDWYSVQGHFPTAATDAVLLARLTGNAALARIVAGNLYWPLGLNPGIPTSKVVNASSSGMVWQASSFIYRLGAPFARAQDGYRIESYSSKGWLDPWEDAYSSHREAWRIDPQNRFYEPPFRSFLSFVNGHVIWDRQWDYWNTGPHGWLSGETFIIADGLFLKAGILFEDGLAPVPSGHVNPYDTTKLAFFDTTHVDRAGTGWGFDDPDLTAFAQSGRAVHEFCTGKEFAGGRFTGHYLDERIGALCVPTAAQFFDLTDGQVNSTGWGFADINTAPWAQVSRAATEFCNASGYVGGFFTGHQLNGLRGVVCLPANSAVWYDSTEEDLYNSGEGFSDINTVPWAKAARAATNICLERGYSGGFFTGHQLNGLHGVVCLVQQ